MRSAPVSGKSVPGAAVAVYRLETACSTIARMHRRARDAHRVLCDAHPDLLTAVERLVRACTWARAILARERRRRRDWDTLVAPETNHEERTRAAEAIVATFPPGLAIGRAGWRAWNARAREAGLSRQAWLRHMLVMGLVAAARPEHLDQPATLRVATHNYPATAPRSL